jgi:hypothetical protein
LTTHSQGLIFVDTEIQPASRRDDAKRLGSSMHAVAYVIHKEFNSIDARYPSPPAAMRDIRVPVPPSRAAVRLGLARVSMGRNPWGARVSMSESCVHGAHVPVSRYPCRLKLLSCAVVRPCD